MLYILPKPFTGKTFSMLARKLATVAAFKTQWVFG